MARRTACEFRTGEPENYGFSALGVIRYVLEPLAKIRFCRFTCDPESEETKQLKSTYRKEREKIIQYFDGKDLVEAALSLFIDILLFL
jgi:hypothetical protein